VKIVEMVEGAFNGLNTQIETLTKERNEAREWVQKLQRTTQTLTCVYCGQMYPPNTPTHGSEVLTEHIKVCEKHPMRKIEEENKELRKRVAELEKDLDSAYNEMAGEDI
jgi:hypothetical protein